MSTDAKPRVAKVAIVSSLAPTLVNFRGPLIEEMVRRGHRVLAFAPDHDAQTRAALKRLGAEPIDYDIGRNSLSPLHDLRATLQLARLLRRHRPDISFAYFIKPVIYGTLAARLAGIRHRFAMMEGMGFVFTTGDNPGMARRALRWATMWLFRLSLSFADRLILLNDDDYDVFVGRRLVAPAKAAVLGGIGVNLLEWSYAEPVCNPITFAFVGRLLRDKGVEEFAAAARILRGKGYDARFVMLGGHDSNPTAIPLSTVEGWVADGLVEWAGHADVRPALRHASVFVLPSYREGVPRSTQEAMALGMPVVTTDVPGCRDTVEDGRNGFLVPAQDAAALALAMEYFLLHPDRIGPMGRESRRIAEQDFDVHNQNRKLLELIGL